MICGRHLPRVRGRKRNLAAASLKRCRADSVVADHLDPECTSRVRLTACSARYILC
jgi:hypothetical protein